MKSARKCVKECVTKIAHCLTLVLQLLAQKNDTFDYFISRGGNYTVFFLYFSVVRMYEVKVF